MLSSKIKSVIEKVFPNVDLYALTIEDSKSDYEPITVVKSQFFEAFVLFAFEILGVLIAATFMNYVGKSMIKDFNSDMLFGILILPLLYILQSAHEVLGVFFVKVGLSEKSIIVKTGFYFEKLDKLDLDTVENIELIISQWGHRLGYGTIDIYSYGSTIRIPHIRNPFNVKKQIEGYIEKIKEDKKD